MKRNFPNTALLLLILLFSLAQAAASAKKSPVPRSTEIKNQVRGFIDTIMRKYAVPGAMVGVWKNDTTVVELFSGSADIATKKPMSGTDRFRAGSITKTFVASVLLSLVDENKITVIVVLNNCNYVEGHMTEVMTGIAGILGGTMK